MFLYKCIFGVDVTLNVHYFAFFLSHDCTIIAFQGPYRKAGVTSGQQRHYQHNNHGTGEDKIAYA
jgi:hypothetical protein